MALCDDLLQKQCWSSSIVGPTSYIEVTFKIVHNQIFQKLCWPSSNCRPRVSCGRDVQGRVQPLATSFTDEAYVTCAISLALVSSVFPPSPALGNYSLPWGLPLWPSRPTPYSYRHDQLSIAWNSLLARAQLQRLQGRCGIPSFCVPWPFLQAPASILRR